MAAGDGKTSGLPFATADGKPTGGGSSGANDFVKNPKGNGPAAGSYDPVTMSRPQPAPKDLVGLPNSQSIPTGGKILKADPGPVSQKVSGTAQPIANKKPFKLGK